jgi:hypothetical protein
MADSSTLDAAVAELQRLHRLGLLGSHLRLAWVRALRERHGIDVKPIEGVTTEPLVVGGVLTIIGWHFNRGE